MGLFIGSITASVLFPPDYQFLGEVLSSQFEELQKKKRGAPLS